MLAILDEDSKNEINNVKAQPKVSEQVKKVSLDPLDRKKKYNRENAFSSRKEKPHSIPSKQQKCLNMVFKRSERNQQKHHGAQAEHWLIFQAKKQKKKKKKKAI